MPRVGSALSSAWVIKNMIAYFFQKLCVDDLLSKLLMPIESVNYPTTVKKLTTELYGQTPNKWLNVIARDRKSVV